MIQFLVQNLWHACKLTPILPAPLGEGLLLVPCSRERVNATLDLYKNLHDGLTLGFLRRIVLRLVGNRLCLLVMEEKTEAILGMALYYFNTRDIKEKTVHEGFSGLVPEIRGRGIGTELRLHALQHFAKHSELEGVSSRVSLSNAASLHSNLKLGFVEKERYYDESLGEERVYLVCDLEPHRPNSG